MVSINLLPPELATGKDVGRFIKLVKMLSVLMIVLTFITASLGVAAHFLLSRELSTVVAQEESLRTTISSLEATEQSLILVKDRMQKINQLLTSRLIEDSYAKQKDIVDNLPEGLGMKESEIASDRSNLDVLATRSLGVSELVESLTAGTYKRIILDSVSFTPFVGYLLSFKIQ